jgi:hypothetical protein
MTIKYFSVVGFSRKKVLYFLPGAISFKDVSDHNVFETF